MLNSEQTGQFRRLHSNFIAYPTRSTLMRFYDFVFKHDLQNLLSGFRAGRIESIWNRLRLLLQPGLTGLDFGAGPGTLTALWREHYAPVRLCVYDLSGEALGYLETLGFETFLMDASEPETGKFDFILCADSLGEIHSDDDDWLLDSARNGSMDLAMEIEQRYGFAEKLKPLRQLLKPGGRLALFEPFPDSILFEAMGPYLEGFGWKAQILVGASPLVSDALILSIPA